MAWVYVLGGLMERQKQWAASDRKMEGKIGKDENYWHKCKTVNNEE